MEYTHTPLGEDVEFLAGSYAINREEKVLYNGIEVFYLVGQTSTITSCCGMISPFDFIKVVGCVSRWRHETGEKGFPLSEVEAVRGESEQRKIRELVHRHHPNIDPIHIEFW
jgi:hypothetical protein